MPRRLPCEPSPAVPRAIEILRLLDTAGPLLRDEIAQRTGVPRSTVLRILAGLRAAQVVEGDRHDGLWRLRERLAPVTDGGPALLEAGVQALAGLCAQGSHEVEVYAVDGSRLRLVQKAAAAETGTSTRVAVGWVHDVAQADCRSLLLIGWGLLQPRATMPAGPGQQAWSPSELQKRAQRARRQGRAVDAGFNAHGILRHAAALTSAEGLRGVLVAAQFMRPGRQGADRGLTRRLAVAAAQWSASLH